MDLEKHKSSPLVTIVSVVWNVKKSGRLDYLNQMIDSVHGQSYPNIEHLIIDGASTDGTLEYLRSIENEKELRIVSELDRGIFDAMNKGIRLAKGKYVAFLNSDDFYHDSEGVARVVERLERTKGDFSYAPCFLYNEDNGATSVSKTKVSKCFNEAPFYHLTMFTKKEVLLKENGFRTDLKVASDSDLICRLFLKKYRRTHISKPFATFRLGGISMDYEQCRKECVRFSQENFATYCGLAPEQAEKMVYSNHVPFRFWFQLLKKGNIKLVFLIKMHHFSLIFEPFIRGFNRMFGGGVEMFFKRLVSCIVSKAYRFIKSCLDANFHAKNSEQSVQHLVKDREAEIGEGTILLPHANIVNPYKNKLKIGKDCILANHFIFESDRGEIEVGDKVFINAQTQIISRSKVTIEDYVTIAWGCMIYDHNSHSIDVQIRRKDIDQELSDYRSCGDFTKNKDWSVVKSKPIRICKDAWLGFHVTILAGVTIGEGAVIGAESVVREDIPPYSIAYGNPAKVVGKVRR